MKFIDSLVQQINLQSEDISRQFIEINHRNESRIQELKAATLGTVKLHRSQMVGPQNDETTGSSSISSVTGRIDQVIQESSHLIHSLQEVSMDSQFSVARLKQQVVQINQLLDRLGVAS